MTALRVKSNNVSCSVSSLFTYSSATPLILRYFLLLFLNLKTNCSIWCFWFWEVKTIITQGIMQDAMITVIVNDLLNKIICQVELEGDNSNNITHQKIPLDWLTFIWSEEAEKFFTRLEKIIVDEAVDEKVSTSAASSLLAFYVNVKIYSSLSLMTIILFVFPFHFVALREFDLYSVLNSH